MAQKLSLHDLSLKGKRVLMRVDFNVPMDKEGRITDDTRIVASLPSIRYILEQGASLILMSHLGRPKEKPSPEFSLAPCAKRLSELLNRPVKMAPDCIGNAVEAMASALNPGDVLLLENLRFHKGEEHPDDDPAFSAQLAKLGDVYVNDAFGTAHRAHASTAVIAKYFPNNSAAGFLLEKEIQFLGNSLAHPVKPFYALIGGAKVSTKIGVLKALLDKVDGIMIGGAMAYTFFKALGYEVGASLCEDGMVPEAKQILEAAKSKGVIFLLPIDNLIADKVDQNANIKVVSASDGIPSGFQGVDIGPKTIQEYTDYINKASTVLWNGPMGIFEIAAFAKGTCEIAKVLTASSAVTIVGGGDSVAALQGLGLANKVSHLSTGGGASLEYIELGTLPGIEALTDK